MERGKQERIRKAVRQNYGRVAGRVAEQWGTKKSVELSGCCQGETVEAGENVKTGKSTAGCCGGEPADIQESLAGKMGYGEEEIQKAPEGSFLGLGCGNPAAIASLLPGETALDLGSGAGIDCFLAAGQVGPQGHVIGVDMTPEMVSKARDNLDKTDFENVDFRIGEIENLPVADSSVDVIMSNCVINLSPDKPAVFKEAFRVLKPGGRLAIADTITSAPLPDSYKNDLQLIANCVGGALSAGEYEEMLITAGFKDVKITPKDDSRELIKEWDPEKKLEEFILSATIEGIKPAS